MRSILIEDTTREEREQIIRESLDCGGGCENCSSCWLGGGSPFGIYQDYIDGKREISEINKTYMEQYRQNRLITSHQSIIRSTREIFEEYNIDSSKGTSAKRTMWSHSTFVRFFI